MMCKGEGRHIEIAVQNEVRDVIDVDRWLTVRYVAENVSKTTVTVDDILSEDFKWVVSVHGGFGSYTFE